MVPKYDYFPQRDIVLVAEMATTEERLFILFSIILKSFSITLM